MGRLTLGWIFVAIVAAGCGAAMKKTDAGGQGDATSAPDGKVNDGGRSDSSSPHDGPASNDGGVSPDSAVDAGAADAMVTPDAAAPDAAVPDAGGGDGGVRLVLLEGALVTVGGAAKAGGLTLEDDGFEGFGPNCSADGSLCLLFGGLGP